MSGTDNRKQSLYFPEDMLEEIQREASRQDRSISWHGRSPARTSGRCLRSMT
jgi:uncharacterized small protein (TIGR04563 family)